MLRKEYVKDTNTTPERDQVTGTKKSSALTVTLAAEAINCQGTSFGSTPGPSGVPHSLKRDVSSRLLAPARNVDVTWTHAT